MWMVYFTRKLNIPISHNREMFEFLKFQGKLLFSDFCSRMISFCQPLCSAWGVKFEFPCVAWHDLSCFLGETIGDTFDLPQVIIIHFSWSSVCCMLSKQISSISSLIISEMTENPTAKDVKFLFCATMLILIPGTHVSSSRFLFYTFVSFANYATFSELVLKLTCWTRNLNVFNRLIIKI